MSLLLLQGLPAAGKSELAKNNLDRLAKSLATKARRNVNILHLEFDDVEHHARQRRRITPDATAKANDTFDPAVWHETRQLVQQAVRHALLGGSPPPIRLEQLATTSASSRAAADAQNATDEPALRIIVLDDNMPYRSMRRAYYRLARMAGGGFCTLALRIPLEVARARNAARQGSARVPDASLTHMAEVMQWPDSGTSGWERRSIVLEQGEPIPWEALVGHLLEPLPQPPGPSAAQRSADAEATAASAVHAADLRLRRLMAMHMQSMAARQLASQRRALLASQLSECKSTVLRGARMAERIRSGDSDPVDSLLDEADAAFAALLARALVCDP